MAANLASVELYQKLGLHERGEATYEAFQRMLCRLGWQGDATSLWARLLAYSRCGGTAGGGHRYGGSKQASTLFRLVPGTAKVLLVHESSSSRSPLHSLHYCISTADRQLP